MRPYQKAFIDFALRTEVLRFGNFELKSGRESPYFFNTGLFDHGASLAELGRYYAEAIQASGLDFDMLYGPAYKGIPLACTCAIALAEVHRRDLGYCFNRKEAKDHGEGGHTVGAPLKGKVLIVDDVISAGTSVGESMNIISAAGAAPAGVIVALDRQERGAGDLSAIQEVERRHGIDVTSVIALDDLCAYLEQTPAHTEVLERIRAYRAVYGCD